MQAELYVKAVRAIFSSIDNGASCTRFIEGKLTNHEAAGFEDEGFFRIERSSCNRFFRVWIVAQLHNEGFTGLF